jgi:hypothetical protein
LLGETDKLIVKQNREIQQIPNAARQWDGCQSATELGRTGIAMEWLLIIMAIRLASNLRRETFATAGKKDMKLVRESQRQAQKLRHLRHAKPERKPSFSHRPPVYRPPHLTGHFLA